MYRLNVLFPYISWGRLAVAWLSNEITPLLISFRRPYITAQHAKKITPTHSRIVGGKASKASEALEVGIISRMYEALSRAQMNDHGIAFSALISCRSLGVWEVSVMESGDVRIGCSYTNRMGRCGKEYGRCLLRSHTSYRRGTMGVIALPTIIAAL